MGMFDTLKSSYDLGEQFTNVVLHTKDFEEGIGGTMTDYWLDPAGQLWKPSYVGCHDFVEIKEDDERYDDKRGFLNFEWIPTGVHGKYQPFEITKYVVVYPANWEGDWALWPRLRLHFKHGILQEHVDVTGE